jgi:DNA-3-methyladenine glycosylase I
MASYHDAEWGVPNHDDRHLFEMLMLEGAQAGLSWSTVLTKRENYKSAFDSFEVATVAKYTPAKLENLLGNAGIIRNRLKVASAVTNAKAFMAIQSEFGSFDRYLWGWVNGTPIDNRPSGDDPLPPRSELSDQLSADLKRRGMKFVGTTIIYAYLQAVGVVNDHVLGCSTRSTPD